MKKSEVTQKRIVVYVSEDDYTQLRSKLILKGLTVSGWFRDIIRMFLKNK